MLYPTISQNELIQVARSRVGADETAVPKISWLGSGPRFDDKAITAKSVELQAVLEGPDQQQWQSDNDAFEGTIAPHVYELLKDTPLVILDDPGFWRYLAMEFWWYASWRQESTFKEGGDYLKYVDGENSSECVILRTFLRGQIASNAGNPNLAHAATESTDLWRSHLTRVVNWKYPAVVKALIQFQQEDRLNTSKLRVVARRLNRRRANVVLTGYEDREATDLLDQLRS